MPIRRKLSEAELALAEVLDDPIWFGEFLRNTKDGFMNRDVWPRRPFEYRWYQKDLLTDQSSAVAVRGGRAIGKCQPASALILTPTGWRSIGSIVRDRLKSRSRRVFKKPFPFEIVAVTSDLTFVPALAIMGYNGRHTIKRVRTRMGYEIDVTDEHPLLTPEGYVPASELRVGQQIAVVTALPEGIVHETAFSSADELKLAGYWFFEPDNKLTGFYPRNKYITKDIEAICERLGIDMYMRKDGAISLMRNRQHYWLLSDFARKLRRSYTLAFHRTPKDRYQNPHNPHLKVPELLMNERREHIRAFLEGVFAQYADISRSRIVLHVPTEQHVRLLRLFLLKFGVFFTAVPVPKPQEDTKHQPYHIVIDHPLALARCFRQFSIAGVVVSQLPDAHETGALTMFDEIVAIEQRGEVFTYSIYVPDYHVYISDGVISHNSLFLEDRILTDIFQHHQRLPETKEVLLVANNLAQIEPVLQRLHDRLRSSPLFRPFVAAINRTEGVFDFRFANGQQVILRARNAGLGNNKLVGLHVNKIYVDEAQLLDIEAWQQVSHCLNDWERGAQVFVTGVPNGSRQSLLYYASEHRNEFKEYHIPAPNNPYYTQEQDEKNKKRYGGDQSNAYQQLVLGNHGTQTEMVITRDMIVTEPITYTPSLYTDQEFKIGEEYYHHIATPKLPYSMLAFGIDCGYVDPTVILILGRTEQGIWKVVHKVTLKRIDYDTQTKIIDWLATVYKPAFIGIDASPGGGGLTIVHALQFNSEYNNNYYRNIVKGYHFSGKITVGFTREGQEVTEYAKTAGADILVRLIAEGRIVFPEVDYQLISEMERIAKTTTSKGVVSYFVVSEYGHQYAKNDHQFSASICFALANAEYLMKPTRSLPKPSALLQKPKL